MWTAPAPDAYRIADEYRRRGVREIAGTEAPIRLVPYDEAYRSGFEDMARRVPDIGRVVALTGWAPSRTLDDLLVELIEAARSAGPAPAVRAEDGLRVG